MQTMVKALDASSDDPNFVIVEEWHPHEPCPWNDQHRALLVLARRATTAPEHVDWRLFAMFSEWLRWR
jgi:hypothetical protein